MNEAQREMVANTWEFTWHFLLLGGVVLGGGGLVMFAAFLLLTQFEITAGVAMAGAVAYWIGRLLWLGRVK